MYGIDLYQRPNSPYWYCSFFVAGKRIRKSTGKTSEREAKRWADTIAERMRFARTIEDVSREAKRAIVEATGQRPDMAAATKALADYLYSRGRAEKYIRNIISKWRSFLEWTDCKSMAAVTQRQAQKWTDSLAARGLSPNTIRRYVSAGSLAWRAWSRRQDMDAGRNPFEDLELPATRTVHYRAFTPPELRRIDDAVADDPTMQALYYLGLYTGLRKGDVCTLRWGEVVLSARQPRIERRMNKTGRTVWIPLPPRLRKWLVAQGPGEPDAYLSPILARWYSCGDARLAKRWAKVLATARIDGHQRIDGKVRRTAGYHSLRHTWAYRALNAGVPIHVAQEVLGHQSKILTAMYGRHADPQQVASALDKMPDPLDSTGDTGA